MQTINYAFSFTHLPPGFKRGAHVALAVFQHQKLLLSRKHAYPKGIYRLLGGGVEPGEAVSAAAARELNEETSINPDTAQIEQKAAFHFDFYETTTGKRYAYDMYLYYVKLDSQMVEAADDVDIIAGFNREETEVNTHRMLALDKGLVTSRRKDSAFRWSDWGQVHSLIHEYVVTNWPVNQS